MRFLPKPSLSSYIEEFRRSPIHFFQLLPRVSVIVLGIFLSLYVVASFTIFPAVIAMVSETAPVNNTVSEVKQLVQTEPTPTPTERPLPTPTPEPSLVPVTLKISKLQIETQVEHVGQTKTLHMDVPKNAAHTAWYVYGAKPGEIGNAVINGHYDTPTGAPAVFFRLGLLEPGDEVTTVSEDGVEKTFVVTGKERHPYQTFPNEYVFFTKPGRNLNLITCDGIWDTKNAIYNDRLVIFTTLIES